jgi:hypothetical protein
MPRLRNRGEVCFYCRATREVTVNLDDKTVFSATMPMACKYGITKCVEEMRDKALLPAGFEEGKVRHR